MKKKAFKVANIFIGDIEGKIVHHIDMDKNNNCVENLAICDVNEHNKYHKIKEQIFRNFSRLFDNVEYDQGVVARAFVTAHTKVRIELLEKSKISGTVKERHFTTFDTEKEVIDLLPIMLAEYK